MAQAKPACGSHPHGCNANVLSIQYNLKIDILYIKKHTPTVLCCIFCL